MANGRLTLLKLLEKYAKGKATEKEREFIELYHQEVFDKVSLKITDTKIKDAIFREVKSGIKRRVRIKVYAAVTTLIIAAVSAQLIFSYLGYSAPRVLYAARGTTKQYDLPDGSHVILNADSRITVGANFKRNRQITLVGEAYFYVEKDKRHPFRVVSGEVITRALGTEFNVKAYHKNVQVTLISGKVVLTTGRKDDSLFLNPNETASWGVLEPLPAANRIRPSGKPRRRFTLTKIRFPVQQYISWKEGSLTFTGEPLTEVLEVLSRRYNVRLEADSTLTSARVRTLVNASDIEGALFQLCTALRRKAVDGSIYSAQFKRTPEGFRLQ